MIERRDVARHLDDVVQRHAGRLVQLEQEQVRDRSARVIVVDQAKTVITNFHALKLRERLRTCGIHPEPRFSDHAPHIVDYRN